MAKEDIGSLVVRIEANLKNFNNGVNDVSKKIDKLGGGLKKIGGIIAGAFAVKTIIGFSKQMIITASDAAEMQSKFNTVFSNMSKDAEDWANNFRNKVGGSRIEIKGMLADSQDMLTGFGATTKQAFDFSTKIQSLGTDLASFQNISGGAQEAVERLRKGLLGETENLKALGIVINQNTLQQALSASGDDRKISELSELEKIQLRYTIALSQSKNAIGDAEKTSGGFANQLRNLKGQLSDVVARLGQNLLPKATEFVTFLNKNLPVVENFINKGIKGFGKAIKFVTDNIDIIIPIMTGLTAAITAQFIIGGLTKLYKAWSIATQAQTTLQWLLNIAMEANPFGLVAAAIGILVAAGIYLYKNWDKVKETALNVFGKIKSFVMPIIDSITNGFKGMVNGVVGALNFMIRALNKLKFTVPDWVPGIGGKGFGFNIPEIPKFAKGTNFVPFDTAAFIHKGEAVIPANNNPSNPNAKNPIGQSINYEGMFNGAVFNVRSDNDIKMIAREIFNLQQSRSRGNGVIAT